MDVPKLPGTIIKPKAKKPKKAKPLPVFMIEQGTFIVVFK